MKYVLLVLVTNTMIIIKLIDYGIRGAFILCLIAIAYKIKKSRCHEKFIRKTDNTEVCIELSSAHPI